MTHFFFKSSQTITKHFVQREVSLKLCQAQINAYLDKFRGKISLSNFETGFAKNSIPQIAHLFYHVLHLYSEIQTNKDGIMM